jgi:hypothetical protein
MTLPSVFKAKADQRRSRKAYQEMESIIEVILQHPEKSRTQQAALANVSLQKFNTITGSDVFDAVRKERVEQLIDPILRESLEKNLLTTSLKATKVISEKLDVEPTMREALETVKVTTQALGLHNRGDAKPAINNNIQIAWLPPQP